MKNKFFTKENIMCVAATIIIVLSYGAQRIIEAVLSPDKKLALILAIIYTLLLAVVLWLISKSNNSYFGILAALIGYKMMPPPNNFLAQTTVDGSTLYYLVGRAAVVLFIVIIYKLYKMQEEPHEIRSLPLLTIMLSVPFFNGISQVITNYLLYKTGNMLYCYFAQFALYTAAVLLILAIAYISGCSSLKFTAYFEYTALSINILRQLGKIGYFALNHEHISKSYFVWIGIYAALMICFAVARKKKEKELA
ncbi:MAG: hypothetical protein IKR97_04220 [Eubacterium sp.]|nr:hypothetical protein [Eubacterium sp.]